MNTSDLISIGSRPLLPQAKNVYAKEPKEVLLAKLDATFSRRAIDDAPRYETYQYEFPGDRTYQRYLSSKVG